MTGDKIGLMGVNGSGKSTLLKILSGQEHSDTGNIVISNGLSMNYLSQQPLLNENLTILEQIYECKHPHLLLLKEYKQLAFDLDSIYDK
ncbi:MAG: ATP-binding cassette domain-containing protein, partial [Candidatus Cloacimonetes bacterium]|nr:ATP-binding cassette domain-containing protein [Candidatus Cloacimonadota bacterium]